MYVEERGQSEILRESGNYHFVMKLIFWLIQCVNNKTMLKDEKFPDFLFLISCHDQLNIIKQYFILILGLRVLLKVHNMFKSLSSYSILTGNFDVG